MLETSTDNVLLCLVLAAIRFVLDDAFTNMRTDQRQELLHVS